MAKKIWVVLQQQDGKLHRLSREAIAAAQRLAAALGGSAEAVLLGSGVQALAADVAASASLGALHVADDAALSGYTPGAYIGVLAKALSEAAPDFVVFPHTYQSMDYFPRLAQQLDAALLPGVTGFRAEGGEILFTRTILGGKLEALVRPKGDGTTLLSVQSGTFSADAVEGGTAPVQPLAVLEGLDPEREILGVEEAAGEQVDLSKAEVIVAAGRGVGGADKMGPVEELAKALGAELGASRPVIDNGWLPRDRQIGSSGQTVAPKLYVAAGISGAIQHLVGMKGSGCVVAINKDPNAPIFAVSNYGIVGDLHEVLPALTQAIQEAKEQ